MFLIDEKLMNDNRAIIALFTDKDKIGSSLKPGMLAFTFDSKDMYLVSSKGKTKKVLCLDETDVFNQNIDFGKDVTIHGSLNVLGEVTNIRTVNLSIEDNLIELNKNENGSGITKTISGLEINRGQLDNAQIIFNERIDTSIKGFDFKVGTQSLFQIVDNAKINVFNTLKINSISNTALSFDFGKSNYEISKQTILDSNSIDQYSYFVLNSNNTNNKFNYDFRLNNASVFSINETNVKTTKPILINNNKVLTYNDTGIVDKTSIAKMSSGLYKNLPSTAVANEYYLATDTEELYRNSSTTSVPQWTIALRGYRVKKKEYFTTTENQTVFILTQGTYGVNKQRVNVYINGSLLPETAYTETNETTITLNSSPGAGYLIIVEYFN